MGSLKPKQLRGILALAVILAGLLVVFAPWQGMRKDSITLSPRVQPSHILIHDGQDSVWLVKGDEAWLLNGQESAAGVTVENILYAASHMEVDAVLSALPGGSAGPVRELLFYRGQKVEHGLKFCRAGELFLVQSQGSERWYSVSLPGYGDLDLETVFSTRASHYLDRVLFQAEPSEIGWVEVQRRGEESFRIHMDEEGHFQCLFPKSDSMLPEGMLDELSLRLLFSYFSDLRFEGRAVDHKGPLPDRAPEHFLAHLGVGTGEGEVHELEVYALPKDSLGDMHLFKACVYHNQGPEPLIVNYIYLDVLMRPLERYFAPGQ